MYIGEYFIKIQNLYKKKIGNDIINKWSLDYNLYFFRTECLIEVFTLSSFLLLIYFFISKTVIILNIYLI